jgi:hypothetical protein
MAGVGIGFSLERSAAAGFGAGAAMAGLSVLAGAFLLLLSAGRGAALLNGCLIRDRIRQVIRITR